ncbi:hypothetical protein ARALYDRAFT_898491 [Arabidopsis lyrata subsp. lyrata]|uniref:Uncharacterized protein n=1 Tax=Arabidopsis lyrata subsp. lyrata TaxID=81972 RepID=D7KZU2_ARALL|nr:hypothetical protein ARALYDRAFT_898491 [Arabidopsis lyrata subsp. lyrata]
MAKWFDFLRRLRQTFLIFNLTIDIINENDLFKHDWRKRSKAQVLQYVFLKWTLACLVGLFTGLIATLINLAVENIAGYKLLAVGHFLTQERYVTGLMVLAGANLGLTLVASVLCIWLDLW